MQTNKKAAERDSGESPGQLYQWQTMLYRPSVLHYCQLATDFPYIPGSFIPDILRAKLGLPICLNIFFICAYWRSKLFTSCTVVPEPREMRLRRLPLITS